MVRALLLSLLFLALAGFSPIPGHLNSRHSNTPKQNSEIPTLRTGWAYDAYPEVSYEKMLDDFARMRANGANAVWIGHNNPGEVDANKLEPGMSYAVYAALQDADDPLYVDARAMADAIKRALDAARAAGLEVVLPIGYQIQMGSAWNETHPNELRRKADSEPLELYDSGYTASPYSAQYRRDISRYYEWIQTEWLSRYDDVIVMLSLADEPMGGDYSDAARDEFRRRYGLDMDRLARADRWKLGEFQAGVIADYATWSANEWRRINPNILTTMSFHGGETARRVWGLPEIETLFEKTPGNFVVSFDAYLHDDLPSKAATTDEAAQLKLFLTTIGAYSRLYQKQIALWGGVNAWGLAQESASPLELSDAVTNLLLLRDLPARMGANLWGIFAWNYNVKQQGLLNYDHPTTYDPLAIEIAVNRTFSRLRNRQTAPTAPDIALVPAPRTLYDALATTRAAGPPPDWFDTTPYARAFADRNIIIASSPRTLQSVQSAPYIIVAARAQDLDGATLDFLRERVSQGSILLATDTRLAKQLDAPSAPWDAGLAELPDDGGIIYLINDGD
ncbi:MAG: hypothetical protein IT331_08870 [Anaerolineae bacterium]|nr:hypothetical protein [Anaerolineae bacterium]